MNDYVYGQGDGFLIKDGHRLFPIGFYELPQSDDDLRKMAQSGVNLIRCGSKEHLDRVEAVGMMGWMSLSIQSGATDALKKKVASVIDHPALVIWEGPDEVVWNFTAWSHLWRKDKLGIYDQRGEWWIQTPLVIEYSENKAKEIMPNMIQAIQMVRSMDKHNRQFWINEARDSDMKFVRQYIDHIDITGCDDYPVSVEKYNISRVGASTERWKSVGKGRPVWMVLQGFSWSDLDEHPVEVLYPTFTESRLMAYSCIAHGARGILYWGSSYLKASNSGAFQQSLYALTSELASLQPFLTSPEEDYVKVKVIEGRRRSENDPPVSSDLGVRKIARRFGREWLIALANEDNIIHMGVEVSGLDHLNGMEFLLLYGDEKAKISNGELITRMMPYEVKLFATSKKWETHQIERRQFIK